MSKIVAPAGVTVPELVVAEAPVNSIVPKFAKGTNSQSLPSHSSKSSTIHSALVSQSLAVDVTVLVAEVPLLLFLMVKVPSVVLITVAVTVTESPAETEKPEKSKESAGFFEDLGHCGKYTKSYYSRRTHT